MQAVEAVVEAGHSLSRAAVPASVRAEVHHRAAWPRTICAVYQRLMYEPKSRAACSVRRQARRRALGASARPAEPPMTLATAAANASGGPWR